MALATLENVVATVGDATHMVSLGIEDNGLVVGPFGTLSWAGAEMSAEVGREGCAIHLVSAAGVESHFFLAAPSFGPAGGPAVMKTFVALLTRSAASAGARVVQPAAT